eukprot:gene24480-biopygen4416
MTGDGGTRGSSGRSPGILVLPSKCTLAGYQGWTHLDGEQHAGKGVADEGEPSPIPDEFAHPRNWREIIAITEKNRTE